MMNSEPRFISPDEALALAEATMFNGRHAESERDWADVLNFWALNFGSDTDLELNLSLMRLLNAIYADKMPVNFPQDYIDEVTRYQFKLRRMTRAELEAHTRDILRLYANTN